jgi:hypothetical protein
MRAIVFHLLDPEPVNKEAKILMSLWPSFTYTGLEKPPFFVANADCL